MADVHRATRGFLYQVSEYPSVKLSLTISIATEPKLKPSTTPEVIVAQGFPRLPRIPQVVPWIRRQHSGPIFASMGLRGSHDAKYDLKG